MHFSNSLCMLPNIIILYLVLHCFRISSWCLLLLLQPILLHHATATTTAAGTGTRTGGEDDALDNDGI